MITVLQSSSAGHAKLLAIVTFCIGAAYADLAVAQEKPTDDDRVYQMSCSHQPQGPQEADQLRRAMDIERSKNQRVADALIEGGRCLH